MSNKTVIRFGFVISRNIKVLSSKCYQPQPLASADNAYLDLDYSRYHKKPNLMIVYNAERLITGILGYLNGL